MCVRPGGRRAVLEGVESYYGSDRTLRNTCTTCHIDLGSARARRMHALAGKSREEKNQIEGSPNPLLAAMAIAIF